MRVGRDAKWQINERRYPSTGWGGKREASVFSVQFGEASLRIGSGARAGLEIEASAIVDDGEMKPSSEAWIATD
jgi:hypothetical protein